MDSPKTKHDRESHEPAQARPMPAFRDVRRLTALAGFRLLWEVSRRYDFTRDKQIPQSLSPAHPITKQHETRHKLVTVMVRRCVEAIPRGHASFEERFPGKRRRLDDGLPPIAPWRSNLVSSALVQRRCLAHSDTPVLTAAPDRPFARTQPLLRCLWHRHLRLSTGISRAETPRSCAHPSFPTVLCGPQRLLGPRRTTRYQLLDRAQARQR